MRARPSSSCRAILDAFLAGFYTGSKTLNTGSQAAARVQLDPAIARTQLILGKVVSPRGELRAGRWGREQPDAAHLAIKGLMDMAPDDRPQLAVALAECDQISAVLDLHGVEPAAADGDGLMMQGD